MSLVAAHRTVVPASLIRSAPAAPEAGHAGLDRVGERLTRGLAELFGGLIGTSATVTAAPLRSEGGRVDADAVLRHVRVDALGGTIAIALARGTVVRLVDLHYGGDGESDAGRDQLSAAENRFVTRIAAALAELLPAAWLPLGLTGAALDETGAASDGPAAVQAFTIGWGEGASVELALHYPLALLAALPSVAGADAGESDGDAEWQARLTERALAVPFSVRAVFARPELALTRLMSLKPGDIIPVSLPAQIDLEVVGLRLARGSAGESNDRAAICIDQF
ncbi:hypothetical protein HMF7854_12480 [Sphingomonas ginkgonis]|uniref:Flagellar motor switch protein FliM n=1 Tax=Sphingomonas ginkgonis TaxID=2315330 RepID=A0A429VCA4_9SPHN|nr:FliM/FliN family flagellar motor switch protein [Sphingomonas ginkgonis]RST31563.1 hypothetical protein HMF7854_12480 [Sphingomonas ginkgonis]